MPATRPRNPKHRRIAFLPSVRSAARSLPKIGDHVSGCCHSLDAGHDRGSHCASRDEPRRPSLAAPASDGLDRRISVAVSLALFFYIRKGDGTQKYILELGQVYMVLMSFALGLLIHWFHVPKDYPVSPMISWIGAVVLMSAAIVPNSPMKTLVAGLIAVSMNPLSMLIAKARGTWDIGPISNVLIMHYPDYLLVGVAVVISRVVLRLGQKVPGPGKWEATAHNLVRQGRNGGSVAGASSHARARCGHQSNSTRCAESQVGE